MLNDIQVTEKISEASIKASKFAYKLRFYTYLLVFVLAVIVIGTISTAVDNIEFLNRIEVKESEIFTIILACLTLFWTMFLFVSSFMLRNYYRANEDNENAEEDMSTTLKIFSYIIKPKSELVITVIIISLWSAASVSLSTLIRIYKSQMHECLKGAEGAAKNMNHCVSLLVGCGVSWGIFVIYFILSLIIIRLFNPKLHYFKKHSLSSGSLGSLDKYSIESIETQAEGSQAELEEQAIKNKESVVGTVETSP